MLAAGDVNRISKNASGLAFDSWHFPYNTGDAQAMGYHAGAALANMESVEATLTPKETGTLYLRINDWPGKLRDNAGSATVEVKAGR